MSRSAIPAATGTPTTTPSPTPFAGARDLTVLDPVPFPANTTILAAVGGYRHGHGGYFRVFRAYRLGDGPVRTDELVQEVGERDWNITGIVPSEDGVQLVKSMCEGARECLMEGPKPNVTTNFYRSIDGGLTWSSVLAVQGEWWAKTAIGTSTFATGGFAAETEVLQVPSGSKLTPPAHTEPQAPTSYAGERAWVRDDLPMLVQDSGASLLKSGFTPEFTVSAFLAAPSGLPYAFVVREEGGAERNYIEAFSGVFHLYRLPENVDLSLVRWLGQTRLLVNATYDRGAECPAGANEGVAPAILDLSSGTLSFIQEPFLEGCTGGTTVAVWLWTGDFGRVDAPGDCLNLRSRPSLEAEILECLSHDVLVDVIGRGGVPEGWLPVNAPSGQSGWVAAAFIER